MRRILSGGWNMYGSGNRHSGRLDLISDDRWENLVDAVFQLHGVADEFHQGKQVAAIA